MLRLEIFWCERVPLFSQNSGGFRFPQHKAICALDKVFEFSMFVVSYGPARVLVQQSVCACLHIFRHLGRGNRPQRVIGQMMEGIEFCLCIRWQDWYRYSALLLEI